MGNNYVKHLGIKPQGKIGTREFNAIWSKYAEKDTTMKKKNALKFLKDFSIAVNVKCDDVLMEKLLTDAGITEDTKEITKDVFVNLFFANAEVGHAGLTRSVMAFKQRRVASSFHSSSEKDSYSQLDKSTIKEEPKNIFVQELEQLFLSYAMDDVIDPPGLVKFITDLDIKPNDVALLVIAFHLKATVMGIFTKDEFMNGFTKLNVNTIEDIKGIIPKLLVDLKNEKKFYDIFKYAHQFYKENPNHKVIPLDVADSVLELLINQKPHIPKFRKFLLKQKEVKAINQDQWINILEFVNSVPEDLEGYDESSSWPFLIDLYVEWVRNGHTGDSEEVEEKVEKKKNEDEYDFVL